MLPKTTKAVLVGVVLGFALSQLVNHLSLRATVRRTQPTEDAAKAASGDIAFTNLRRDGAAAYYDAEGYHLDDDALRETPVASLHPSKDQEVTWGEYARILAQRKEAIVLTRAVGPWLQRHVLLTAIVTSAKRIASGHTLALHGTWGVDASHLVYFAERDVPAALPAGMDLVQMDLLDSEAAWEEKELAVVRHLGALYCDRSIEEDRFDWFLVATDEVYVASHVLENRLNQLDANLPTCLGVFGGAERNARFFGGAVVYSKELMSRLGVCLARGGGGSVRACLTMLGASCIEGNEVMLQHGIISLVCAVRLYMCGWRCEACGSNIQRMACSCVWCVWYVGEVLRRKVNRMVRRYVEVRIWRGMWRWRRGM